MTQGEFDREINRLRGHFGERPYGSELVAIFWAEFGSMNYHDFRKVVLEAIATHANTRAPLRDDFRTLAEKVGANFTPKGKWKYLEVDDCLHCGGCGWFWVERVQGGEAVVACHACGAGLNLQSAPKPHITHTLADCAPGTAYRRPGRNSKNP